MMNSREILTLSVRGIADAVWKRELSASDVLEAYIAAVEATDGEVNAYITKTYDLAAAQARRADERIAAGELPALAGAQPERSSAE